MKRVIIISGLLLLFFINCGQKTDSRSEARQGYQARSNRLGGSASGAGQTTADGRIIYVVAGTAKTELAAIQAARKFQGYGFESNVFRAPNGAYIITVATTQNQTVAEQFLRENIKRGKLSERAALSFGENWVGPIYAPLTSSLQGTESATTPQRTESETQNIYIPSSNIPSGYDTAPTAIPGPQASQSVDAFASGASAFYLLLAQTGNESQALSAAQQYIRQGLTINIYETTSGYAVTLGGPVSRTDAESLRSQMETRIGSIKIVATGPEWKRQIFP